MASDYTGTYRHRDPDFGDLSVSRIAPMTYRIRYRYKRYKRGMYTELDVSEASIILSLDNKLWTVVYPEAMRYPDGI